MHCRHTIWFSSTTRERPILHVHGLIVVMSRHIAQSRIDSVTTSVCSLTSAWLPVAQTNAKQQLVVQSGARPDFYNVPWNVILFNYR